MTSAAFSPDGRRIATGGGDLANLNKPGEVKVWDAATGAEMLNLKGHTSAVYSVAFSPEGERIVTGSGDKTARVWDADTVKEKALLTGHTQEVRSVRFSPDGQRLFAWDAAGNVRAWATSDGKPTDSRDPPALPPTGAGGEWVCVPRSGVPSYSSADSPTRTLRQGGGLAPHYK